MTTATAPTPPRRRIDLDQHLAGAALDAADAMVVITDTDGVIRYVNRAFTDVTGYPPEEAVGGNPRLLSSGQHDATFYRELWDTVLSGKVWEGELINRRRSGELYTDRMTISPVRDATGTVTHLIAVKRDVSARLDELLAASPYGVLHLGADAGLVYANRRGCELLGARFDDLLGRGWRGCLDADDAAWLADAVAATNREGRVPDAAQVRTLAIGGRSVRLHLGALRPEDGTLLGCVVALEDVTAEVRATAALQDREVFARSVLEAIDSPTAVVDERGVLVHVNPAWSDGPPDDPLIGRPLGTCLLDLLPTADTGLSEVVTAVREAVTGGDTDPRLLEHLSPGPRPRWWHVRVCHLPVRSGGAVLTATDVTALRQAQQRSEVDSITDPLTGLRNRRGLELGLASLRGQLPFSVLFVDLDRFKPVNDTHGHGVGDDLLRRVAERLRRHVRHQDLAARVGGDEFALALPRTGAEEAALVAERLGRALAAPYRLAPDLTVRVGASIGVATDHLDLPAAATLEAADRAMYARKRGRRADPDA